MAILDGQRSTKANGAARSLLRRRDVLSGSERDRAIYLTKHPKLTLLSEALVVFGNSGGRDYASCSDRGDRSPGAAISHIRYSER